MGLLNMFFPKEKDFYGMLTGQSQITLKGICIFSQLMATDVAPDAVQCIADVEHEADKSRRLLIDDLNHTFITPIEREDIFSLSRAIDDILDLAKSAIEEFQIYKLSPNDTLRGIIARIKNAEDNLHESIALLKDHPNISIEKCAAAKDCVDDIEILYYQALAILVEGDDIKYIFKMREIYKHVYQLSTRIDDAANIILDIIVKTT
ncbi:MAG: DUF47 family protein [Verrucomicrobia bacterium]|nr:DUF47 family protein [Verrucomicrobiota bacterium]MBU4247087.1 DUF47 family protein [Verrucomicrobiota bacterium]MBU4290253.1 DUF47 family protein [Verrucomicrobiota bacterium]MBU4498228.1 DUF47 family protein [Verrucomicrobiota bacterium]MCG2679970.1 DUF47 family protein [Kiritimatiellia bacterium]